MLIFIHVPLIPASIPVFRLRNTLGEFKKHILKLKFKRLLNLFQKPNFKYRLKKFLKHRYKIEICYYKFNQYALRLKILNNMNF